MTAPSPPAATATPALDCSSDSSSDSGPLPTLDPLLVAAWSRIEMQSSLRVVLDAIVGTLGFEIAAVVARDSEDGLQVITSSGRPDAVAALRRLRLDVSRAQEIFAVAEDWGALLFLPDAANSWEDSEVWQAPEARHSDDPGEWQPRDELYAPFYEGGDLIGFLSIDRPTDGRRPDLTTRRQVESLARLAEGAMIDALTAERGRARGRAREAARTVARRASSRLDVGGVIDEVVAALIDDFGADGAWARVVPATDRLHTTGGCDSGNDIPDWLVRDLMAAAEACWSAGRLLELSPGLPLNGPLSHVAHHDVLDRFGDHDIGSLLQVPLGAGDEFLGYVMMARSLGATAWTDEERSEAITVGRDVGRAVLTARTLERERHLVEQLQKIDGYQRELVQSFSHELRTPLTSLGAYLEMLEDDVAEWPAAEVPLSAMRRATSRLAGLVADLLLLSQLADPDREPRADVVDLGDLALAAVRRLRPEAEARHVELSVEVPAEPVLVRGDPDHLDRAVLTVIDGAQAFTPVGGRVRVRVERLRSEVRLQVHERGAGARPAEERALFETFYSGDESVDRGRPGRSLSLRITERIMARHSGRVEFASEPDGTGSRFLLVLPG